MFMKQNDLLVVIGVAVIVLIAAGIFIVYPSKRASTPHPKSATVLP